MLNPKRLKLIKKEDAAHYRVGEEGLSTEYVGLVEVECADLQAFAEIVNVMLNAHLAVAAVQQAMSCLQMARRPQDRVDDLRMLNDIHFKLAGFHYDSAAVPPPMEGVKPSAGAVDWETAQKMFLDPKVGSLGSLADTMMNEKKKILEAEAKSGEVRHWHGMDPFVELKVEKAPWEKSGEAVVDLPGGHILAVDWGGKEGDSQVTVIGKKHPDGTLEIIAEQPSFTGDEIEKIIAESEKSDHADPA